MVQVESGSVIQRTASPPSARWPRPRSCATIRRASASASRNPSPRRPSMDVGLHQRRHPQVACPPARASAMTSIGRAVGHDLTVPEQQDTVCVRQCKVHVVRDEVEASRPGDGQDLAHERGGGAVILPADGSSRISVAGRGRGRWRAPGASAGRTRASAAAARGCPRAGRATCAAGSRRRARRTSAGSRPRFRGPKSSSSRRSSSEEHLARALEDVAEGRSPARPSSGSAIERAVDEDARRRSIGSRRMAVRKSVVLPEPLGPSTATTSSRPEPRVDAVEDLVLADSRPDVPELEARRARPSRRRRQRSRASRPASSAAGAAEPAGAGTARGRPRTGA